jgi:hypothetical protein
MRFAPLLMVLAACGSHRTTPNLAVRADAGADGAAAIDGGFDATPSAGTAADYRVIAVEHGGLLRVTLEWPSARAAMRRSPGRTPCATARSPRARIGTLHGVADALVIVDVGAGKPAPPTTPVRITVRECAVTPLMTLAPGLGDALEIQSQDTVHHAITATTVGSTWVAATTDVVLAMTELAVMGHTVAIGLPSAGVIAIVADGATDDPAYVIAPPHPYAAITDEIGRVAIADIPPGTYDVHAWLPARAGSPAVTVSGSAVIAADAETELTLVVPP